MSIRAALLSIIFSLFLGSFTAGSEPAAGVVTTYQNPFRLEGEWYDYGIGDPYILRWNGRYYLYPSTSTHGGGHIGVKVWSSVDLVHWRYDGLATTEPITRGAYAPEVVYWNGTFYMYTSPEGQGHYVLTSRSPTGPFTVQTGNLGCSIDGSVFIDDDGRWYFTHAGHRGIRGRPMPNPYTMGPARVLEADLGHWTEGPMIVKRAGIYYLTYTGNHLLSKGYRVAYSVSKKGPLGPYRVGENNPLIISTEDSFSGLGHSCTFLGPDLDSYYIAYHNRVNRPGPLLRHMNIDRLVFNGQKMDVLGPTKYPQRVPRLPDFYTWLDEDGLKDRWMQLESHGYSLLVSKARTGASYTAEYNLRSRAFAAGGPAALFGVVFSYKDANNLAYALLDAQKNELRVVLLDGGEEKELAQAPLLSDLDLSVLHTLRVVKGAKMLSVFLDNLLAVSVPAGELTGGGIGYLHREAEPTYSFTAFSNLAEGSSDFYCDKPIPGTIEGVHYSKYGGHPARDTTFENSLRPGDSTRVRLLASNTYSIQLAQPGEYLTYNVNVAKTDSYAVDLMVKVPTQAELLLTLGGQKVGKLAVSTEAAPEGERWIKVRAGTVNLPQGFAAMRVTLLSGQIEWRHMDLYAVETEPFYVEDPLTDGFERDWDYFGPDSWSSSARGYTYPGADQAFAIIGQDGWTDYNVEVDLEFGSERPAAEAGLLLRATNASYYEHQVKDSLIGYYVAISGEELLLKKLCYDSKVLRRVPIEVHPGRTHHLRAQVVRGAIRVYWDDSQEPVIEYVDPEAYMHGRVGLRSSSGAAYFRSLCIRSIPYPAYARLEVAGRQLWIVPKQRDYRVVLPFGTIKPPVVSPLSLPDDAVIDPQATIDVVQAASLPGEATIRIVDEKGAVIHTAKVHLEIDKPTLGLEIAGVEMEQPGWAGQVAGIIDFELDVPGSSELFREVSATLWRVIAGVTKEVKRVYSADHPPGRLRIDTLELEDGTYELEVKLETVYGSKAERRLRFAVRNWKLLEDELLPPVKAFLVAELPQMKTTAQSDGWRHQVDNAEAFFGDDSRLACSEGSREYLVWELPGLRTFQVTAYARKPEAISALKISISADGEEWTPVPYEVSHFATSPKGWMKLFISGSVVGEAAAGYIRLSVEGASTNVLQLGRVELRALLTTE